LDREAGSHDGAIVIFAQAEKAAYARIRNRRWSVGFDRLACNRTRQWLSQWLSLSERRRLNSRERRRE